MAAIQTNKPHGDDLAVTIFLAATSRPEGERTEYIGEACGGDEALQAEVQRRVDWEKRMAGFLLTPIFPRERLDRPFAPGDVILRERYRILREAGEGGMGVVFEAFDTKVGWRVALKCPRYEYRKRLTQEAAKALRVHHPNVCRVFEIHTDETEVGEVDFLTMEFVEGETLAEALRTAPPRWLETAHGICIAKQICAGLRAVHEAGIVHRDLKTANVMLASEPGEAVRAVIMDFGIAHGDDLFTSAARGTPAYLAPEIWKGRPATIRSDIYALGVVLYEMACGRQPFPSSTGWRERLQALPPPPAGVSARLRPALERCLHPDPEQRFASVTELEAALWPQSSSRRGFLYAAAGLAITGAAAWSARETFWPTSPVRLVILQPVIPAQASEEAPLVHGFLQDLSYRFKTLRRSRRPVSVYAADQLTAATHALSTELRSAPGGGGWRLAARLSETRTGSPVIELESPRATGPVLAGVLFSFESLLVLQIMSELHLRAEPRPQTLHGEAYANYLRGLYFARVDYENAAKAIPHFERVIAAAPNESLGYAGLAEALLGQQYITGDRSFEGKAVTALAKAEQLDPDNAHVFLMSGRLNAFAGKYERALVDFRRAAEIDPNDAQAFIGMGYALLYLGRYPEVEAAFQSAFAAQPGYYKPHLEAGIAYWERSRPADAERNWLEAVRLNPTHSRAKLNLAILYLKANRMAEAERQIQESLKLRRALPALQLLGDFQDQIGLDQEAIASYEEAIRVGPPEYKTWGALAAMYRKVGREADALKTFRQGLNQAESGLSGNPRDPDRLSWCAFYYAALGDAARARFRASEAAAVASSPVARVRTRLVLTYDALGDVDSAVRTMAGAPREWLLDFGRTESLTAKLRQDPRFIKLGQ